ncbi:ion transporter [Planctomycetota bacterium]
MVQMLRKIAFANWFGNFILGIILLAGLLVGLETYPAAVGRFGETLHVLEQVVLWIFVVEALIKIGAEGRKPWRYFLDPWNVFDFTIVVVCFLPIDSQFAAVLRLARILRTLRLVTALPRLQVLVGALLKSIPSMGYVSILLFILFYIYAVLGTFTFKDNDPHLYGDLHTTGLTLFRVVTLEDWTDVMYTQMYGSDSYGYDDDLKAQYPERVSKKMPLMSVGFHVSFVLFGTMVMLNLFIGVIITGMDEARAEAEEILIREERLKEGEVPRPTMLVDQFVSVKEKLAALTVEIDQIRETTLAQETYKARYADKARKISQRFKRSDF